MEKLKDNLTKRLYRHLEENLDPMVKAAVSTQNRIEILRCVVDWVHKDDEVLRRVSKAKVVKETLQRKRESRSEAHEKLRKKSDEEDSLFSSPEFMEELEKL